MFFGASAPAASMLAVDEATYGVRVRIARDGDRILVTDQRTIPA